MVYQLYIHLILLYAVFDVENPMERIKQENADEPLKNPTIITTIFHNTMMMTLMTMMAMADSNGNGYGYSKGNDSYDHCSS